MDSGSLHLTTARLELRPFADTDAAELLRLFQDPGVRRYLLDDLVVAQDWVGEEIQSSKARFGGGTLGLWAVRATDGSEIIGFVGFRPFFDPPELQLLYGLLPDRWGQGLATECAGAACDCAFDVLGFEAVRAATDLPNTASVAVLHRLGMSLDRATDEGEAGTGFFSIDRVTWLSSDEERLPQLRSSTALYRRLR